MNIIGVSGCCLSVHLSVCSLVPRPILPLEGLGTRLYSLSASVCHGLVWHVICAHAQFPLAPLAPNMLSMLLVNHPPYVG